MLAEAEVLDAAAQLAALLEAAAARGLKHPRHAAVLGPVQNTIKRVMKSYFGRQKVKMLRDLKPKIKRMLVLDPAPLKEAGKGGKTFANSVLPSSLHPLRFEATRAETNDYADAIQDAIMGAATTLAKETKTAGSLAEDFASNYLRDNSLTKLTGELSDTSVQRLRDAMADAWDAGGSFQQIMDSVADTFADFSTTRAEMIAQTEANDAYNAGRSEMADELGFTEKSWETESGAPCDDCLENERAGWIDIDDDFPSGDDQPTAHPNCFLAGTLVTAAGVTSAVRRWYEGDICQITAGVEHFSVTPNHPILGAAGWIRAGHLKPGDYVAQCLSPSRAANILDPHDHHIETSIEQIADTLFMAGGMSAGGVPVAAEAFHGDAGTDCKVNVVRAAGALPRAWSYGVEDGEYNALGLRHSRRVAFLEKSDFLAMLERLSTPANGGMSSSAASLPVLRSRERGTEQRGLAHSSLLEADVVPVANDSNPANSDALGNVQDRLTRLMRLVQISKVDVVKFSGHVYNLETEDGIYLANSIIAHNCQCSLNYRKGHEGD